MRSGRIRKLLLAVAIAQLCLLLSLLLHGMVLGIRADAWCSGTYCHGGCIMWCAGEKVGCVATLCHCECLCRDGGQDIPLGYECPRSY